MLKNEHSVKFTLEMFIGPGPGPRPVLKRYFQHKITLVYKHSDWLLQNFNQ